MIGVILPSRGLIFSETAEEILANLKDIPHKFFFAHGLPIPECFEKPVEAALSDETITHLWFVEDDMKLPKNTLKTLLVKNKPVVTADYPINKDGRGSILKIGHSIVFCGTGCLLVQKEVFGELSKPYFRTDIRWNVKNMGDYIKITGVKDLSEGYGLHDVNFCINLYRRNIPIHTIDLKLGQRKLVSMGSAGTNDGAHNIEVWTKIKKDHLLKQIKKWPVEQTGNLVVVATKGGEIMVSATHAETLVKKGLATIPPKRDLVVDDSEVL